MKILLSGYHNPNFINSMVYREKAIEYMGHELIAFNDGSFCLPGRVRDQFAFLNAWDLQRINDRLVDCVHQQKPDVCFIVGGHRILPDTVARVKKSGTPIILWTTDAPKDFKNILAAAPVYDHLSCAGSEAVDIFQAHGLHNVTWVPFACDPYFHKQMVVTQQERAQYGRDAVFVGSYYPNRGQLLEALVGFDLGVWGPYWGHLPSQSPLKGKAVDIKMNYDQWVKIYNAARIVLVVHYQDADVPCHQASPKLFEAMACGCFVLCDRQKDVLGLFKDKEHLVFFDNADDLRDKVRYYLEHEQERRAIAQQGQAVVIAQHTYAHRFKQMLGILQERRIMA